MYAASFQQFLIGDIVAWNHRIGRERWGFWVWLKACKWLCCHQMYAASFQQFLIGDIVAWNHCIGRERWGFQAFAKPG